MTEPLNKHMIGQIVYPVTSICDMSYAKWRHRGIKNLRPTQEELTQIVWENIGHLLIVDSVVIYCSDDVRELQTFRVLTHEGKIIFIEQHRVSNAKPKKSENNLFELARKEDLTAFV